MNVSQHKKYMERAFQEAQKAGNRTLTNPLVGAVVVKKGKIVSFGYHGYFGGPHAEEISLKKAGRLAKGADLYITLEPCSSFGKRPPCTEIINKYGIKNVYFAQYDINPLNTRKSIRVLKKYGIHAKKIDSNPEWESLNAPFRKYTKRLIPYIFIKAGLTLDGKICDKKGKSKWITSKNSLRNVHDLRSRVNAVLIGANTFNKDNPRLNVRVFVKRNYNDPAKVILTARGNINISHNLIKTPQKSTVIIATTPAGKKRIIKRLKKIPAHLAIESFASKGRNISLKKLLKRLALNYNICSLLVEGGAKTFSRFIDEGLYDRLYLFYSPRFFGTGKKVCSFLSDTTSEAAANPPKHKIISIQKSGPDIFLVVEKK